MQIKTKNVSTVIFSVLLAVIMVVPLSGCNVLTGLLPIDQTAAQEQVIRDNIKATNDLDLKALLKTCDSNTNNLFNGASSLLSSLLSATGTSTDVTKFIMNLFSDTKQYANKAGVKVEVEPTSFDISQTDNSHATATVMVNVKVTDGGNTSTTQARQEYQLVKEGADWKVDLSEACQNAIGTGVNLGTDLFSGLLGF